MVETSSRKKFATTDRGESAGEKRVLLHGVSWSTYKALSKDLGNSRSSRLSFDSGGLEIMSPLIPDLVAPAISKEQSTPAQNREDKASILI